MNANERQIDSTTEAELLAAADAIGPNGCSAIHIENGYLTTREWAARWDCSWQKSQERVRKLISMGHMECRWNYRDTSDGRHMRRPTYAWSEKIKKPPAARQDREGGA